MQLSKDLREFIDLLNANGVEFLVVGGFAVAWHGHPRFTADIDFLIRPDYANAGLVVKTLRGFGFGEFANCPGGSVPTRPDPSTRREAEPEARRGGGQG